MQSRRTAVMGWAQSLVVVLAVMICISGGLLTHQLRLEGRLHRIATQEAQIGVILKHMYLEVQSMHRFWQPHGQTGKPAPEHLINALDHSHILLQSLKQATAGMNLDAPLRVLDKAMADTQAAALAPSAKESLGPWRQALYDVEKAYRQAVSSARQASAQGYTFAHRALMLTMLLEFVLVAVVVWLGSPQTE